MRDITLSASLPTKIVFLAGALLLPFLIHANPGLKKSNGSGIVCSLAKVVDSQRSGLLAYTYFVPKGWQTTSNLKWTGMAFSAEMSTNTPDNKYVVVHLEPTNYSYNVFTGGTPKGLRLTKASDFLHILMNSLSQKGNFSNVKIVEETSGDLPLLAGQKMMQNLPKTGAMFSSFFHQTAYLKATFELNGVSETASMGTTVIGYIGGSDGKIGYGPTARRFYSENDNFVVGPTLLVVTPSNPPAAKVKECRLIASSLRVTPKFSEYCSKVALSVAQAGLAATQQRGRQQIQDMQAQTQKNLSEFKSRMAARDANCHDFCNYIADKQDYKSSTGSIVTLPANYSHAWDNGKGQYVVTDDPTYDPRGTGSGNWKQMPKAHQGK